MSRLQRAEQVFFRALNEVVEPAVRRGVASHRWAPSGLIVLETVGFRSGKIRRTPLLANRLGRFLLVSTYRGERSFWVRNLEKTPAANYYLGGERHFAQALVIREGETSGDVLELPRWLQKLVLLLRNQSRRGWAFTLLASES